MAAYMYAGRVWNVSAQIAGEELEKIEARDGEVTPKAVVDAARPVDSALHRVFEWDDEKAAEQYRLSQASTLIRCITVKPAPEESIKGPVRMFVNCNPIDNGQKKIGSYINYRSAFEDPETREVILSNAKYELRVFRNKYSKLKELAKVFESIDMLEGNE